jgi:PleD family two-component response regulator
VGQDGKPKPMANYTILIAHEDPLQRQVLDMLLGHGELKLVVKHDGKEVLAYLRDATPDAAVLSATLPLVNGMSLCRKMKAITRLASVPVVLVLPSRDDPLASEARAQARYAQAELTLPLPLGDKNLRERLMELLEKPRQDASPATGDTAILVEALYALEPLDPQALRQRLATLEEENRKLRELVERQRKRIGELEAALKSAREKRDEGGGFGLFRRRRNRS